MPRVSPPRSASPGSRTGTVLPRRPRSAAGYEIVGAAGGGLATALHYAITLLCMASRPRPPPTYWTIPRRARAARAGTEAARPLRTQRAAPELAPRPRPRNESQTVRRDRLDLGCWPAARCLGLLAHHHPPSRSSRQAYGPSCHCHWYCTHGVRRLRRAEN